MQNSAAQVRLYDYERYVTTLFAPAKTRPALWALYAFHHEIDKIKYSVTEKMMGLIRFQWWRDAIEKLYDGQVLQHEVLQALDVHKAYWCAADFYALIDAYEAEFEAHDVATKEELWAHAEFVATPLLKLACKVTGQMPDEATLKTAGRLYEVSRRLKILPSPLVSDGNFIETVVTAALNEFAALNQKQIKRFTPLLTSFIARRYFRQIKKAGYKIEPAKTDHHLLSFYLWLPSIFT